MCVLHRVMVRYGRFSTVNMTAGIATPGELAGHVSSLEAEIATLRLENTALRVANAELERVVVRDTLTPLFNRRHFIACLNERIGRVVRYGLEAAVMFVDVDNMKGINDRHGHAAGDFVLLHTARIIAGSIRATDVAARIGGDEFALILDSINIEQALAKRDTLDRLIRETTCRYGDAELAMSASLGCTAIAADDTEFKVIARADGAMYQTKRVRRGLSA